MSQNYYKTCKLVISANFEGKGVHYGENKQLIITTVEKFSKTFCNTTS